VQLGEVIAEVKKIEVLHLSLKRKFDAGREKFGSLYDAKRKDVEEDRVYSSFDKAIARDDQKNPKLLACDEDSGPRDVVAILTGTQGTEC
jgi:hypothetical protein